MGHLRVLVVEDDVLLALNASDIISDAGHEVVGVAQDKVGAVLLAKQRTPNLAFVDLHLKDGFTGPEVGIALTMDHKIPVLFVTGHVHLAPLSHSGVIGALAKPYSPRQLTEALSFIATHSVHEWTLAPPHLWLRHAIG
jgi:two-component system, response regulator PdtaR